MPLDRGSEFAKDNFITIMSSKLTKDYRDLVYSEAQKGEYYDAN